MKCYRCGAKECECGSTVLIGDVRNVLSALPEKSVHCCVTSPPYWGLRDYGVEGQIGLEATPEEFVETMVGVFREVRRVLRDDGTLWLNLGDSYNGSGPSGGPGKQYTNVGSQGTTVKAVAGLKPKDLVGIPWRVAFALQADGWYLRQDIIWSKPNPMPESVRDRCTKAHEYIFLLSKSQRYYFNQEAIAVEASQESGWAKQRKSGVDTWKYGRAAGGDPNSTNGIGGTVALGSTRNRRSVWTVTTQPYPGAHFATFPPKLIEPCILAGCPEGGTVLDPFGGSGTTLEVARRLSCKAVCIELNEDYAGLIVERLRQPRMF